MITHKMREFLDYKAGKLVDKIVNQFLYTRLSISYNGAYYFCMYLFANYF